MKEFNHIITIGLLLIIAVVLSVGGYFGLQKVDKFLELKARNDCALASRYTLTIESDNVVVYYPVTDMYHTCLEEKGY